MAAIPNNLGEAGEALETIQDRALAEKLATKHSGTNGAVPPEENPLSRVIGGFADDPLWVEFIEEMEQSRRELDRLHGLTEQPMYVLDNDTASLLFRGRNRVLNQRALAVPPAQLWLPAVVVEEQFRGRLGVLAKLNPSRPRDSALIPVAYRDLVLTQDFLRQFRVLPYTQADEDLYQSWSAAVKRVGTRDCRIAAIALNRGFTVVTANLRHFQQVPDLQTTDWGV